MAFRDFDTDHICPAVRDYLDGGDVHAAQQEPLTEQGSRGNGGRDNETLQKWKKQEK